MFVPLGKFWIVFLGFVAAVEQAEQAKNIEAAQQLTAGMSRDAVLDIMGPPGIDYRPTWNHWCYGTAIDFQSVCLSSGHFNPIPLKLRLFSYSDDDVVVRWDDRDRVIRIDRPSSFDSPEVFQPMLDVVLFIRAVDELLRSNKAA